MAKSYLIDFGNSSVGPIGACARIRAENPEAALEIFRELCPETVEVDVWEDDGLLDQTPPPRKVIYFNVYLNPEAVTLSEVGEEAED